MKDKNLDIVVNTDQSGFQLELHSGRTLEEKGVKRVEIIAQSKNALTHSYTVMPTMTASGILIEPMYIVLKEPQGSFGPNVRETMFRPPNLLISCSASGKMGRTHLTEYMEGVFVPHFKDKGITPTLICDAWSTFTEKNITANLPDNMDLEVLQIPAGGTGISQPWDVRGFRTYKQFVRYFSDFVTLNEVPVKLFQRDNILKLQSLLYRQLCSPRFQSLFQSSWYKCGYVIDRPATYQNPVDFCYHGNDILCDQCEGLRLLTCSWCKISLCFHHFFTEFHLCHNFVQ